MAVTATYRQFHYGAAEGEIPKVHGIPDGCSYSVKISCNDFTMVTVLRPNGFTEHIIEVDEFGFWWMGDMTEGVKQFTDKHGDIYTVNEIRAKHDLPPAPPKPKLDFY